MTRGYAQIYIDPNINCLSTLSINIPFANDKNREIYVEDKIFKHWDRDIGSNMTEEIWVSATIKQGSQRILITGSQSQL